MIKIGRQSRQFAETGLYHIVVRGVNHCHLFEQEVDYMMFSSIVKEVKKEMNFKLYAYCLMSNHVHLLVLEEKLGDISIIMKRILTHYACWFNRKYERSGSLIANRYKSECINNSKYLFSLVRYIHQNPIRAGITGAINEYTWSSYNEYLKNDIGCITDKEFILETLSFDKEAALNRFVEFHKEMDSNEFMPVDIKKKTEATIRREIMNIIGGKEPNSLACLNKSQRNKIIKELRESGLSIREIERATGISRGVIAKC